MSPNQNLFEMTGTGIVQPANYHTNQQHSLTSSPHHEFPAIHLQQDGSNNACIGALCVAGFLFGLGFVVWALRSKGEPVEHMGKRGGKFIPGMELPWEDKDED